MAPQVHFHKVRGTRWEHALCRLVAQARQEGRRVYLLAESEPEARRLDDLLWTYEDVSFVPHGLWQGEEEGCAEPVAVGWRPGNPNGADCLALAGDAPDGALAGYPEVLDLAPLDVPDRLRRARARYRAFQEAGCRLVVHEPGAEPGR